MQEQDSRSLVATKQMSADLNITAELSNLVSVASLPKLMAFLAMLQPQRKVAVLCRVSNRIFSARYNQSHVPRACCCIDQRYLACSVT